jgi:chemotaxis protein histidine kinase CheA
MPLVCQRPRRKKQNAHATTQTTQNITQETQAAQTTQEGKATQTTQPAQQQTPSAQSEQPTTTQPEQNSPQAAAAKLQQTAQPPSQQAPQTAPPAPQQPPTLPQNLLFQPADSTPQTIDRYLNNLREILNQVQQTLSGRESPETTRVLQEVRALEAQIDFTSQIRNQLFVQLPLFHNGQQTLANIHVYKDAKKSSGGGDDSATALIALETANMGHFETYVQKSSRAIRCQFRLETDTHVEIVRNNIHKLSDLLRESGYSLEHFSFLPPGEPYTVLDNPTPPPHLEEMPYFDKRV